MAGFDISQLQGTPLYQLAKNANVYGGKTLSKTEMVFFQQQCREMGFSPEQYGLEIIPEDIEGENYKETRKNQEKLTNSIRDAYKGQFGKKNNAIETAQGAETKAYAIIHTAKEAFTKAHGENLDFVPDDLGHRPNFMDPQYKDNLTKYVTDLNVWAGRVAEDYRNAADMTSKDLAEMVMRNDDKNAAMNAGVTVAVGEAVMNNLDELQKQIADGTAQIIKEVKIQGNATRVTVKDAEGKVIDAIRTAEGHIISETQWQNWYTRNIVIDQGVRTRETVEDTAQQTQVLNGYSDKINVELKSKVLTNEAGTRISNMRNMILQSDLPFEERKKLMAHLASFSTQNYFSERDLDAEEAIINVAINGI